MNELFGVSMTVIASVSFAITAAILGLVAVIAWRNPVMFKTGLRNIPRRPAQTALIVIGLMLSTLIMTAAFGTGDTLSRSITSEVYGMLGEADEIITWDVSKQAAAVDQQLIPLTTVDSWRQAHADDPEIEAFVPFLSERLPVQDTVTGLNEASANIVAFRASDARALGGLRDTAGRPVELQGNELAVNKKLADLIDARPGHKVLMFYGGKPVELVVKAIVPNEILGGSFNSNAKQGGAVDFAFLSDLTHKGLNADGVIVSNTGGVKGGLAHANAARDSLEATIAGQPFEVQTVKRDGISQAELFGSLFTTFFIVLGLFSIAAGILLIFLIFVMLAAERKPEMGMARAVGAKRRQLVESFLAEGMGYDLGSAVIGLFAGVAVTFAMIGILRASAGEAIGLNLQVAFTPRSLITAFCLGIIATFIVIFFSSWRASRLNIVSAIRDLPEAPAVNPEAATGRGYVRAALNGVVVLAAPVGFSLFFFGPVGMAIGAPSILVGLVSPWFYALRGANTARPARERTDEGPPRWPWVLGLCLPVIGWALILPWYFLALLLVRLTRDRKPRSIPLGVVALGMIAPPFGLIPALLQDAHARISWSVGLSFALAIIGAASIRGGLDTDGAFFFALGITFILLWVAISLRYFKIAERLAFTAAGGLLLAFWYVSPAGKLERVTGPLDGGPEMFFLSGFAMVTAGTFIVVYNADLILPAVATVGSRFGRIVPAIKTGIAYPLTARFRTGMTMAMIGLIMFALVMNSTLNDNFERIFLSSDSLGGWDVQAMINSNNRISDVPAALSAASVDAGAIRALGETRLAFPFEAEVENRDRRKNQDGEIKDYSRYRMIGADEGFIRNNAIPLEFHAAGYATDRDAWNALASGKALALLPASVTLVQNGFGPPVEPDLLSLKPVEEGFEPFTLNLRDPSGKVTPVTVIGQMKNSADSFWMGIVVSRATFETAFPDAKGQALYFALQPGVDADRFAKQLESGLVQASVDSLHQILDDQQAASRGFFLVFQGFMGLGLIIGIAALSVVASRAVVERRQQIGMLRAIGYQRRMVALSFLFESSFVAMSGILLGLVLGLSLAWVLFTSGAIGPETQSVPFHVPWAQLGVVAGLAFAAASFMTFLPARAASRVPIAEALRYE